jgi:TatD family-associated radical SAM protein
MTPSIVYAFRNNLYVNLTNRCPTACFFCVKRDWDYKFYGQNLAIRREPEAEAVVAAAGNPRRYREVVFCGFGEPTMRLEALKSVGARLRAEGAKKIRLNTIGLGSLVNGRNIVPELRGAVDAVSVSLNTADPIQWEALHRPARRWAPAGFAAVNAFIAACVAAGLPTTVTAIQLPGVDLEAVRQRATALGAAFRQRPALKEGLT